MLTPQGRRLDQRLVEELAAKPRLVLLCGRYEGFDDRIREGLQPLEVSVGDFICNGGEVPAMLLIDTVMRLVPGVLGASQPGRELRDGPSDEAPPALLDALDATLAQLVVAREAEGRSLAGVLGALLDELERGLAVVVQRAPLLAQRYREKLLARVGEVLAAHAARLEPSDVAQQVALFADKADVTEEIERLRSHLARARAMLAAGGAVGRSLEFLIQEMLREVNTIGSKSPDVEIAHEIVAMKSTVVRLKEQVANLE